MLKSTLLVGFALLVLLTWGMFKRVEKQPDRQAGLIEAVRRGDVAAVRELVKHPVDIYAPGVQGESAIILAEKSGNKELYEALAPRRNHDMDLRRAQDAVDAGRGLGLQPQPDAGKGIDRRIVAVRQDGTATDRYLKQQRYAELQAEIQALPDVNRKQELLYTLASYQSTEGFYHESGQTADLMPDAEKRAEFFIASGSNRVKDLNLARQHLLSAGAAIAQVQDPHRRDSLYAQLAFAQKTRAFVDDVRMTCNLITLPEYKNVTCK